MIKDKDDSEYSEYRKLCTTLGNLYEKYLERKLEIRRLLEKTAARRKDALLALAKANRFTRHLTGRQRYISGLSYHLGDITRRINQAGALVSQGNFDESREMMEIRAGIKAEMPAGIRELRSLVLVVIRMIDRIKKYLLQFDLLEKRCHELILSIGKALEAFYHEVRIIYRKIYPFGLFSFFRRYLRSLFGKTFFTSADMDDVGALGNFTKLILKIADSPIF